MKKVRNKRKLDALLRNRRPTKQVRLDKLLNESVFRGLMDKTFERKKEIKNG